MKIIVFGATGGTGRATARALAAAGHRVTGFARDPSRLSGSAGLETVHGDVMRAAEVAAAIAGHDAVIVSLGNSQNPFAMALGARRTTPADVCEVGTRNVIAGMRQAGVGRLLVVSAYGIGNQDALPLPLRLFYRTLLREHMADKEKQEILVKASGLDWTLVQPVGLTDGKATGEWLADTTGRSRRSRISRADVAAFLVTLIDGGTYQRATVALSG